MDSLITELRNLVATYNNKPNFIFLKALCLITWAVFLLKLSVVPVWLVIIPFCLIFINHFCFSYIKLVKAQSEQLKKEEQKKNEATNNFESINDIKSEEQISTNK